MEGLASHGSDFQHQLNEMCKIEPWKQEGEDRERLKRAKMKPFLKRVMEDPNYDSGLTMEAERKALIYALLKAIA